MCLLNRCVLFLVFVALMCTTSLAVPPWKQAQRYERELMQAQLKYQQAANRHARDVFEHQKRLSRLEQKYRNRAYRLGAPAVYSVSPVPARICPPSPTMPQPVVVVPTRRTLQQSIYQIVAPRLQYQVVQQRPTPTAPMAARIVIRQPTTPAPVSNRVPATDVIVEQPVQTTDYIVEQSTTEPASTSANSIVASVAMPTVTKTIAPAVEPLPELVPTPAAIQPLEISPASATIEPDPQPTPAKRPGENN